MIGARDEGQETKRGMRKWLEKRGETAERKEESEARAEMGFRV